VLLAKESKIGISPCRLKLMALVDPFEVDIVNTIVIAIITWGEERRPTILKLYDLINLDDFSNLSHVILRELALGIEEIVLLVIVEGSNETKNSSIFVVWKIRRGGANIMLETTAAE
jgi:hypothetical protein